MFGLNVSLNAATQKIDLEPENGILIGGRKIFLGWPYYSEAALAGAAASTPRSRCGPATRIMPSTTTTKQAYVTGAVYSD